MNVSQRVRTGGAFAHLLLVVVLAVGVFVMHTMGHPADPSSAGTAMASHPPASATHGSAAGHEPAKSPASMGAGRAAGPVHTPSTHTPPMAMDMASLCVAVLLAATVLAALLRAALGRVPDRAATLPSRARLPVYPNPPPLGPDLTRLSVLRL